MNAVDTQQVILRNLAEVWALCPDMRLGQLMMTLGQLAEDETERTLSLWEVEDAQLRSAMKRFLSDLTNRLEA